MKRIFLTGASSGIGRAIAETLTNSGHEVWATSRDPSRLPQLNNFHPIALDLSDSDSINDAFAQAGEVDVLINNAGGGHFGPAELMPLEELRDEFQTLVFGHVQLVQLALGGMRERGSGMIINVTSLASRLPVPFMASYNAAKAAMASFTMTLQLEMRNSGVRIVDLQPADIRTDFNRSAKKFALDAHGYRARAAKSWRTCDHNMQNAPGPELVAKRVSELIMSENPPPRVTVGDFFQSSIAPFIIRFLPMRLQLWGIAKYYGI
ncbi:MAG: SDR family oxidoreductase [Chthoniobacterales bacterium]